MRDRRLSALSRHEHTPRHARAPLVLILSISTCFIASLDAHAAGGNGGQDVFFGRSETGTGGQGYNGSPGASTAGFTQSIATDDPSGAGGGGAGGGAGGSVQGGLPAAGGQGGTSANVDGQNGADNTSGYGGGGGGGGANGATVQTLSNAALLRGGNGGNGGTGGGAGGGGGGGAGGYGAVVTGNGVSTNTSQIRGGTGGDGGQAGVPNPAGYGSNGGGGGDGGVGIQFTAPTSTLVNSGSIVGGNGGTGGAPGGGTNTGATFGNFRGAIGPVNQPGAPGVGGIGVVGSGLTIDNAGGTIAGGFANGGTGAQAYAVQLTGGTNYVGTGGTITGGIYVASGSLQPSLPGSSVGTPLAVGGPIAFAPGTFYNVRITPTANDKVVASGAATLSGAAVKVLAGNGTYTIRRYTILTAQTISGTFSGVTSNLAFLTPTLTYDANNVFLNITATGTYTTAASTQNQYNLASGLTNAAKGTPGGAGGEVLVALNQLTVAQAQAAFDSLSGEGIAAAQNVANRSAQLFNDAIFDQTTFYGAGGAGNSITLTDAPPAFVALAPEDTRAAAQGQPIRELADLPSSHIAPTFVAPGRTWRAWASGFGGVEDIHGNGAIGSAAQDNTIYGGALGVDYQLTPNYLVGVALGGSDGDFSVPGRATSGSTTGGHVAFYDLATFGQFYGASSNSFSYYTNNTTRSVAGFGGLAGETERGDFDSHEFRTRLEFGRHFDAYGATLTPFVALEIAELRSNGFGETAVTGPGLFRLDVSGQSAADVPGYVGLRVQNVMALGGMTLLPSLQVAYVHEFAPYRSQIGAIADLPGSTFLVDGAQPARDAAQVKAGGELRLGPNAALFANFDGEFSGVSQLYAGKGGFKYLW